MTTFWERNAPLMALQYVRRWALVKMDRDQSVADHSLRVWVLARDLFNVLDPIGHNSDMRQSVERWAIIHDADEYWTSDIPGNVKKALNKIHPGIFDQFADGKFARVMPEYLDIKRGIGNTATEAIVKIADLVESRLYLRQHGVNDDEIQAVDEYIKGRLVDVLDKATMSYTGLEWHRVLDWINEVMAGDSNTNFRLVVGLVSPGPAPIPWGKEVCINCGRTRDNPADCTAEFHVEEEIPF